MSQTETSNTIQGDPAQRCPVVLFDGLCPLCDGFVLFVLRRDPREQFHFASLQSAYGQSLLRRHGLPTDSVDTMVLVQADQAYTESSAVLRVAAGLRFPWRLLSVFLVVPPFIRNAAYRLMARNRYRWFGRREACAVPNPEWKQRFHK